MFERLGGFDFGSLGLFRGLDLGGDLFLFLHHALEGSLCLFEFHCGFFSLYSHQWK